MPAALPHVIAAERGVVGGRGVAAMHERVARPGAVLRMELVQRDALAGLVVQPAAIGCPRLMAFAVGALEAGMRAASVASAVARIDIAASLRAIAGGDDGALLGGRCRRRQPEIQFRSHSVPTLRAWAP